MDFKNKNQMDFKDMYFKEKILIDFKKMDFQGYIF